MLAAADTAGSAWLEMWGRLWRIDTLFETGQLRSVRVSSPIPAMRMAAWAHGLAIAIRLGRTEDIEFLAARFEPFRGQHVANGAGPGVYMGPVELPLGQAAAALGHLDPAVDDLQTAASICDANGARGCAVQARVELAAAFTRRQAPGDRDEAMAALAAAAREAGQLGMVPFTEWIEQLQAQLTAAPPGDAPSAPRARGGPAGRAGTDQQADRPDPVRL